MTTTNDQSTEFQKFHSALRKIVSVPKSEIVRREEEYQRRRKIKNTKRGSR